MSTKMMLDGGTWKREALAPASAFFMKSTQMGSAARAPERSTGVLSSKPTQTTHQQVGREAHEPGVAQVVGGARLAGRVGA